MVTPWFAMAAVTIAICRLVAATSNWPIALIAVCASSGSSG